MIQFRSSTSPIEFHAPLTAGIFRNQNTTTTTTATDAIVKVGNRIEVTYSGSHHYGRRGRVTKVHNTRLTVVFENHDGNDGNWIDKDKVLVIMEKPNIPRVYETSSRFRYKHPEPRLRSEHQKTRKRVASWFVLQRRALGFTSPFPKIPYIEMVSRKGLQDLLDNYRFASTTEETKPHLIRSDIGDFMLEVDWNVILLILEYLPEGGIGLQQIACRASRNPQHPMSPMIIRI
jgi:hypothetical protein